MTVRRPHVRQPCSKDRSSLRRTYGMRSGSVQKLTGQPFWVSDSALARGFPGDFSGGDWVSAQLLASHKEDSLLDASVLSVLKWESGQGVSAGDFGGGLELYVVLVGRKKK